MRWGLAAFVLIGCAYSPPSSSPDDDAVAADASGDSSQPDAQPDAPPPDAPATAACPGYQAINNGFPTGATYRGVSTRMTWQAARQVCQADGGDLVVVDGDAEGAAIIQLAQDPGASPFLWVGLQDDPTTVSDNDFLTVRGGAAQFTPWGTQQPNGGTADCVLIADDNIRDMWDFVCNAGQVFVCECLPSS